MAIRVHAVPLSSKKFIKEDLELSKLYFNKDVWPGYYDNKVLKQKFPTLKYVDRRIVKISDVDYTPDEDTQKTRMDKNLQRSAKGNINFKMQKVRAGGRGKFYKDIWEDMRLNGYELCHKPLSVCKMHDGKIYMMDGRTRLEFLIENKFENIIVDYYECSEWLSADKFAEFSNPPEKPRSPQTKEDIITLAISEIDAGRLKPEEVVDFVHTVSDNQFSTNATAKIIACIHAGESSASVTYKDSEAREWLKDNGYHDNINNNGIYYFVSSKESAGSSILAAAKYHKALASEKKKVKELRIVINPGVLEGASAEDSWKKRIDDYRSLFENNFNIIKDSYFENVSEKNVIRVFGAIPTVKALSTKYPMDKLVMFNVGKLKYKTFSEIDSDEALSRFFAVDEEETL